MLNGCCRIYQQPAVPASDIAQYGIKILKYDENALPKYPENTRAALQRYVASCPCTLALLPLKQSIYIPLLFWSCTSGVSLILRPPPHFESLEYVNLETRLLLVLVSFLDLILKAWSM